MVVRAEPGPVGQSAQAVDYARDVRPILEKFCYECHGPKRARGSLRLHTPELILRGGASGSPVTPGQSELSLLVRRVLALDGDDQMPLDRDPLPASAVAVLRAWIDQGAAMSGAMAAPASAQAAAIPAIEEHWAYVAPVRKDPPAVTTAAWPVNAIDRFVLARLEREGLAPSPEADRALLLRRVTLDLIGLPPTPDELNAFLADRSPDAYKKVVDRLLASPHYGERWARPWLDLARYADTNGYEKDNRREIWKYRDWVIAALNRDLPFDRFTVEQIAGDMLPNATEDQRIATGFHRNAMTNEEGGVDPEESMYETLVDRVNTTATTWLGTTLACAQCHNHKYDPFSQKDYFRFLAFFANSDYESRTFGDGTRFFEARLDLATREQEKARAETQKEIEALETTLKTHTPELQRAQSAWEQAVQEAEQSWTPLVPATATASNGVVLRRLADGSVLASGPNPALTTYTIAVRTTATAITGLRLVALPDPSLPKGGPGRDAYGHFRLTGIRIQIAPAAAPGAGRGSELSFSKLKVDDSAYAFTPEDLFEPDEAKRTRSGGAWTINAMRDTARLPRQAVMIPASPFGDAGGTLITIQLDHLDGTIGQGIGRFRLDATTAADPLAGAELTPRFRAIAAQPRDARAAADVDDLQAFYRSVSPLLDAARKDVSAARKKLAALQIASTLVMKERQTFERPSYELRERGAFTARGARVFAAAPKSLHPMRDDLPANRLGLARWLVDEKNPLVARVAVNRLWEQVFGRGLVETSEDFGTQGSPPSHPELLDWLATEFVANGWSQKRLLETIVTSATYRQSSAVTPALVERDPYNRLLARGPRFRLEAEMVRDLSLSVSGRLNPKMFGPSAFPLQPPGIWNQPYSSDKWITSEGDERFRRSLYTFWRRTSPYPSFMTFDATSREYCSVRRVRTNTPLQALTLLNDPASFDAARALARRILREPAADATAPDRVRFAFTLVLTRAPKPAEIDRLLSLLAGERARYAADRRAAAAVVDADAGDIADPADLAAWTIVANVLLNLDETITKG